MWKRYNAFLRKSPELTIEWHDAETDARGWLVINSLRGNAAGGGTRMRAGANVHEVTYLAKTMELKFALAGPAIGGAKTAIDFDPHDPRKNDVLERWYRAISPLLRSCYGTGGDLNIDEVVDVIPAFQHLGLHHPQEGVVRGHLHPQHDEFLRIVQTLDDGVKAPVDGRHGIAGHATTVADMITGYGVAQAVRRFYEAEDRSLDGTRVQLEGFGNVGAAAGLYLARSGARIVAISDADHVLIEPDGLDAAAVQDLMLASEDKLLPENDPRLRPRAEDTSFLDTPADIFVCAAVSGSVTDDVLDRLEHAGVSVIASGANQPFREARMGSTKVAQAADKRFSVLPDFLANCGMARAFSYLMEPGAQPTADPIFEAVDRTVGDALAEVLDRSGGKMRGLFAGTLAMAMDRIGA